MKSEKVPQEAWIDEKIGDAINFLILLEGLYREEAAKGNVLQEVASSIVPERNKNA